MNQDASDKTPHAPSNNKELNMCRKMQAAGRDTSDKSHKTGKEEEFADRKKKVLLPSRL